MANKFTTKVTNEGLNLLQLASQQDKKVEFINVIASSTVYGEKQLISETYDDINSRASKNQTGTINNLTIDKNITKMELVFDGHDIKSDYTLNSIFLIAKLKDSQDLKLFAIIKANQPQYMNSYDGSGSTNLQINLGVKFSNNDKVTLQIDTAAIATLGDLSNLRNETQAKLDKETTRATEKEKNLALDIETEKNRAIKAENTLQTNIDTIDSRAQSEEKKLSNKLDTETTRAIQSEQELQGKVETEKNRAQTRENVLKSLITSNKITLNATVLNEQIRAKQAEENLQSKITRIEGRQNRPPTGYILDTRTKPWTLLFDNGCRIVDIWHWNNGAIFRPAPPNQRGQGDYPMFSIPSAIMNVIKGNILYSDFKNSGWNGGFFDIETKVENPINNGDKYNWDRIKIMKDGTSAKSRAIFARVIYELGIWSDEIVEELGAVRKAGN